jgi:hypothetical protein
MSVFLALNAAARSPRAAALTFMATHPPPHNAHRFGQLNPRKRPSDRILAARKRNVAAMEGQIEAQRQRVTKLEAGLFRTMNGALASRRPLSG